MLAYGILGLAVLGLAHLVAFRRDRLVLFVPLVVQTAVFVAGAPETRYGYPLLSSVFLLAAHAVVTGSRLVRRAVPASAARAQGIGARRL
jgi:hypothetical protein